MNYLLVPKAVPGAIKSARKAFQGALRNFNFPGNEYFGGPNIRDSYCARFLLGNLGIWYRVKVALRHTYIIILPPVTSQ